LSSLEIVQLVDFPIGRLPPLADAIIDQTVDRQ
jgi:hypothetical protein